MSIITLNDLSVGSKIKYGQYKCGSENPQPLVFEIVSKNTFLNANNISIPDHITLRTVKCIDYVQINTASVNKYSLTALRQYLNKSGSNWFVPNGTEKAPDISAKMSFQSYFSPQELKYLVTPKIQFGSEYLTDGFYLCPTKITTGKKDFTQQCLTNSPIIPTTTSDYFWLGYMSGSYNYISSGSSASTSKYYGLVPYCNIRSDISIDDTVDSDNCYVITGAVPTDIQFDKDTILIKTGTMNKINATVVPLGTPQTLTYSSSDPSIISVDSNGYIKALKPTGDTPVIITVSTTF